MLSIPLKVIASISSLVEYCNNKYWEKLNYEY